MALLHVDFFSDVLGMCAEMDVILPNANKGHIGENQKSGGEKWKTLYLLHGMSDDHTIWQRYTSIERYANEKGIAVVMPTTHLGWYTDMAEGFNYFTYITDELPKICRSFFPNMSDKREDTYVAGLSMGGYGAMKCILRAPDTFSWGAALSGGLDVEAICNEKTTEKDYWRAIFGPFDKVKGSFNDLFQAAEDLKESGKPLPKVFMWCGTEDFLYEQNTKMRDHLNKLGYDLTYSETPGDHQWKYWDREIQNILNWLPIGEEE